MLEVKNRIQPVISHEDLLKSWEYNNFVCMGK